MELPETEAEPLRETISTEVDAIVMPSLEEQMDETGVGDMDMRMQVGQFSHPETGEPLGEIMMGMSGKVWVEFDAGHRVVYELQSLVDGAIDASLESEHGPEEPEADDE